MSVGTVTFSTEDSSRDADDVNVTVTPGAEYITADDDGANARAAVSVTDQYGDPVPDLLATLTSSGTDVTIIGRSTKALGDDGAYTFRYERTGATAATETLTASVDHDDDANTDDITGTATVEWAGKAVVGEQKDAILVRAFDTETNTVYAGADGSVVVVSYDSNDRFDLDPAGDDPKRASSYAEFERSIAADDNLSWIIVGTGSRAINTFTLVKS